MAQFRSSVFVKQEDKGVRLDHRILACLVEVNSVSASLLESRTSAQFVLLPLLSTSLECDLYTCDLRFNVVISRLNMLLEVNSKSSVLNLLTGIVVTSIKSGRLKSKRVLVSSSYSLIRSSGTPSYCGWAPSGSGSFWSLLTISV